MRKFVLPAIALVYCLLSAAVADAGYIVGGKMLTSFGILSESKERTASGREITSVFEGVAAHSRLFATFITPDRSAGAHVELGLLSFSKGASPELRHGYGWWQYGRCRILAGHTDNWIGALALAPSQHVAFTPDMNAHLLLVGWGTLYLKRRPQLSFTWMSPGVGYQVAMAQPMDGANVSWGNGAVDGYAQLPEVDLAVQFRYGGLAMIPAFMWVRHRAEGVAGGEDQVDAWALSLPAKFNFGGFSLRFALHYTVNIAAAGGVLVPAEATPVRRSDGRFSDTSNIGGLLALHYRFGKARLLAGFGFEHYDNDAWKTTAGTGGFSRRAFFLGGEYAVNKHFLIHPEVGSYHYGDDPSTRKSNGSELIVGVEFQFVF